MDKFLWINPVATEMYDSPGLRQQLEQRGFEVVACGQDHIAAVREKYRLAIAKAEGCLADMRCPLAVDYIKAEYNPPFLEYPAIEPILLHCARELQQRLEGKGRLYVTTPCEALRDLGRSLNLPGVAFLTWVEFVRQEGLLLQKAALQASPIPPGFFGEYGARGGMLDSKEKIDEFFSAGPQQPAESILELLYCPQGCHKGNGV